MRLLSYYRTGPHSGLATMQSLERCIVERGKGPGDGAPLEQRPLNGSKCRLLLRVRTEPAEAL